MRSNYHSDRIPLNCCWLRETNISLKMENEQNEGWAFRCLHLGAYIVGGIVKHIHFTWKWKCCSRFCLITDSWKNIIVSQSFKVSWTFVCAFVYGYWKLIYNEAHDRIIEYFKISETISQVVWENFNSDLIWNRQNRHTVARSTSFMLSFP